MAEHATVVDRIMEAVRRAPGCQLDDLVLSLPGLTWNQVFLEVDRMSRTGQVRVTSMGEGNYTVTLPSNARDLAIHGDRLAIPFFDGQVRIYELQSFPASSPP